LYKNRSKELIFIGVMEWFIANSLERETQPAFSRKNEYDESYFLEKVLKKHKEEYRKVWYSSSAINKAKETLNKDRISIKKDLAFLGDDQLAEKLLPKPPSDLMLSLFSTDGISREIYIRTSPPRGIIIKKGKGRIMILGENLKNVKQIIDNLKGEMEDINSVSRDLGLKLERILSSNELVEFRVKNLDKFVSLKQDKPKNEFEQEMIKILSRITDCYLSNISISFSHPTENFEYDSIVYLGDDLLFDIEFKNYEMVKDELYSAGYDATLKNKVITEINDKATRLHAEPLVITKGFPQNTLDTIRDLAQSRNVTLIPFEDQKTEANLLNHFLSKAITDKETTSYLDTLLSPVYSILSKNLP